MEHRTERNLTLINLVSEFERETDEGLSSFLGEKDYNQLIHYYEDEQLWDRALDVVEVALTQFNFHSEFFLAKSRILLKAGNVNDALVFLDKAEELAPFEIEISILRAKIYAVTGATRRSLELLASLKETPLVEQNLVDLLICESFIHEMDYDYDLMYSTLTEAALLDPKNMEVMERLLLSTDLSRNFLNSLNFHKKLLDRNPYNFLAWHNLGHAYSSIGEYEDAVIAFEYSFITNERFEQGYLECADTCFQLKRYIKAYDCYQEANNLFGDDPELLVPMAACQILINNPEIAREHLMDALKLDPFNEEIYFYLGNCYSLEEDWYKAINAYHKAISIEECCEEYYLGLAKAYVAIENFEKSVFYFSKATRIGPEQSDLWREFILYLIKQERLSEALTVLDEADDYTFSADLLYCRAAILLLKGDKKEGFTILEEALAEDFDQKDILFKIQPEFQLDNEVSSMIHYFETEENPNY